MRAIITFNNLPFDNRLQADWGFSAYIEGFPRKILFDTGADGDILLSNMKTLGIDPRSVDLLFFSHSHWDHTGGARVFLRENPDVSIYILSSFAHMFKGYKEVISDDPQELTEGVLSTGRMGTSIEEQSLLVNTAKGWVIFTGCSHSNVAEIVERAKEMTEGEIYLVIGGFHLGGYEESFIKGIIGRLREVGLKNVAPSHCTGEPALRLFKDEYGGNYLETGVGSLIEI